MRILSLVLWLSAALMAQRGLEPKPKAADYPVSARGEGVEIGAEYLVHTLPSGKDSFFVPDYLVIEVAVYPAKGEVLELSGGQFWLRINKKKQPLAAQPAGFVAASLKYPDWNYRRSVEAGGSMGNVGIILGRDAPVGRYPGDPNARRRLPEPTKVPQQPQQVEREPQQTGDQAATETALPEGKTEKPVSGHLYFEYKGKAKAIKSLELIYRSGEKTIAVPLL